MSRLAVVLALGLTLAGCSTQVTGTALPVASMGTEQAYIASLAAIDPGLVVNPDRAIRRGKNVCESMVRGDTRDIVIDGARLRFDGGDAAVDGAKAALIVGAIESTGLCRR